MTSAQKNSEKVGSASLVVSPKDAFTADRISVKAVGLEPSETVIMTSRSIDDTGVPWIARGTFIADFEGSIDLSTAPSESGTFTGLDASGLFWSMAPNGKADRSFQLNAKEDAHQLGRPVHDTSQPVSVEIEAEGITSGIRLVTTITLRRLIEGIDIQTLNNGRLRGRVFRWRDRTERRGAVMMLGGSGGGIETNFAPAVASLGYDVVCLAYFAYDDLPKSLSEIPLEYFEECFAWMEQSLSPTKIAVQGTSRGGELALILGAEFNNRVAGVLGVVPMFCVTPGWTTQGNLCSPWSRRGEPLPFPKTTESATIQELQSGEAPPDGIEGSTAMREDFDKLDVRENYAIQVEKIAGPVLLISGVEDAMWPSPWGSELVINRLRAKGFTHPFEHLALRETGHITPLPNTITTFVRAAHHPLLKIFLAAGGNAQGAARSSWAMWSAVKGHYTRVFGVAG